MEKYRRDEIPNQNRQNQRRYYLLDALRGFALINMIVYHGVWDLVHIFGADWKWYLSEGAYVWQQCICWTFILLSGFCWSLGKKRLGRGLTVFGADAVVTVVTLLFMPQDRVVFGVLTLIGSCMLLWILLDKIFCHIPAWMGMAASFLLFVSTRNVNSGYLGFECWKLAGLPKSWYENLFTAFLGFPRGEFYSTDYFSLIPWIFLFGTGYFLYHFLLDKKVMDFFVKIRIRPLEFLGRHSLIIYLAHQPLIYGLLRLFLD